MSPRLLKVFWTRAGSKVLVRLKLLWRSTCTQGVLRGTAVALAPITDKYEVLVQDLISEKPRTVEPFIIRPASKK